MPSYSDVLFGRIALANRLVSPGALGECLAHQERSRELSLAEVMVRRGVMPAEVARRVQKAQALTQFVRAEKIFARLVLSRGLVDADTLRECFRLQREEDYKVRLGQLLVEGELLTPDQVEEIVDQQLVALSEETARIEEAGFSEEEVEVSEAGRKIDDMARIGAATDLEGAVLNRAVGPRGLLADEGSLARTQPFLARRAAAPGEGPAPRRRDRGRPAPPEAPVALDPGSLSGTTMASRYRVLEKIGEGGMGTVYRAEHCLMEKVVALKVLHPRLLSTPGSLERFRREIRAASRFQHRNVAQIYDAGEGEGGTFYMAMELAEGQTLEELLSAGPLPAERALEVFRQVLSAVAEAHAKGIVHRDLKSGNVVLTRDRKGEDLVKVLDFGLAKIAADPSGDEGAEAALFNTEEGTVTGTPQYMSPEQCSGEAVDHRSDLYSLGVILFEVLTGRLPFTSHTPMGYLGKHIVEPPPRPSEVGPVPVPEALERVVLKLLEKRPEDRYQSAPEVQAALDGADPAGPSARSGGRSPGGREGPPNSLLVVSDTASWGDDPPSSGARPPLRDARPARTVVAPAPSDATGGLRTPPRRLQPGSAPESSASEPLELVPSDSDGSLPADAASARTVVVDPPSDAPPAGLAPRRHGLLLLVGVAFVAAVSVSTTVAIVAGRGAAGEAGVAIERAERLLAEGRADEAVAELEALLAERPAAPDAEELLARARAARDADEARRLAARGAELEERWRVGTVGREGAERALEHYARALALDDDPEVRRRAARLREELDGGGARDGGMVELPPARGPLERLEEALEAGRLAEAERLLPEAEALTPVGHPRLEFCREQLEAERLAARARSAREAGRLAEARRLLEEARATHPRPQAQERFRAELADLAAETSRAAGRERVDAALARIREAVLALDLTAARAALAEADALSREVGAGAPSVRRRQAALEALTGPLRELATARQELSRLEESPAPDLDAARGVRQRLDDLRLRVAAAGGDDPLVEEVARAVEVDLERAQALLAATTAEPQDELRARFERLLARARAGAAPEHRTRSTDERRLQELLQLQAHPAHRSGRCAPEDQAWVDREVERYERRMAVWDELGAAMVLVPGGSWEGPDEQTHELPPVFFVAEAEVTCAQWDAYLHANDLRRPRGFHASDLPVTGISLEDAERYCAWLSRRTRLVRFRLPTEAEWERAALGPERREYPWGDGYEPWRDGAAAVGGSLQRVRHFSRTDCNAWGLCDLVGNVQELTSTRRGGRIVIKGGSIVTSRQQAAASADALVRPGEEVTDYIGLRVFAEEVEGE